MVDRLPKPQAPPAPYPAPQSLGVDVARPQDRGLEEEFTALPGAGHREQRVQIVGQAIPPTPAAAPTWMDDVLNGGDLHGGHGLV